MLGVAAEERRLCAVLIAGAEAAFRHSCGERLGLPGSGRLESLSVPGARGGGDADAGGTAAAAVARLWGCRQNP